ncbi:hypothetical protein QJS66_08720 [Kocuria rhizophila]|nr:hypothetical protein QJS66_08720 [Kocuria rhizophila]
MLAGGEPFRLEIHGTGTFRPVTPWSAWTWGGEDAAASSASPAPGPARRRNGLRLPFEYHPHVAPGPRARRRGPGTGRRRCSHLPRRLPGPRARVEGDEHGVWHVRETVRFGQRGAEQASLALTRRWFRPRDRAGLTRRAPSTPRRAPGTWPPRRPREQRLGAFFAWAAPTDGPCSRCAPWATTRSHGGPLMAAGLAYQLLFASTALLVIFFAALATFLGTNSPLRQEPGGGAGGEVRGCWTWGAGTGEVIPLELLEHRPLSPWPPPWPGWCCSTPRGAGVAVSAWRPAGMSRCPAPGAPLAAVARDLG